MEDEENKTQRDPHKILVDISSSIYHHHCKQHSIIISKGKKEGNACISKWDTEIFLCVDFVLKGNNVCRYSLHQQYLYQTKYHLKAMLTIKYEQKKKILPATYILSSNDACICFLRGPERFFPISSTANGN